MHHRINWIKWMRFPFRKYTPELGNFVEMFISNDFQLMKFRTKRRDGCHSESRSKLSNTLIVSKELNWKYVMRPNVSSIRSIFSVNEDTMEIMIGVDWRILNLHTQTHTIRHKYGNDLSTDKIGSVAVIVIKYAWMRRDYIPKKPRWNRCDILFV